MNVPRLITALEEATLKSLITKGFKKCFANLPDTIQAASRAKFRQWQSNAGQTDFRELNGQHGIWRISIGSHYRALCQKVEAGTYRWYWIGSHSEYNGITSKARR